MAERFDVCVIGAGPAGIATTLELAGRGCRVALVESGAAPVDAAAQPLADADILTPESHGIMRDAVSRGLGGTSALWGGRCVPLDALDFEARAWLGMPAWPLGAADLAPHYRRACEILGIGAPAFTVAECVGLAGAPAALAEHLGDDATVCTSQLERWTPEPRLWNLHGACLQSDPRVALLSGMTCVGLRQSAAGAPLTSVLLRPTHQPDAPLVEIVARHYVLAAGGIDSVRLVLNAMRDPAGLKPAAPQLVGRYYLGHPSGKIAEVRLAGSARHTLYGFERDGAVYVRRRITFRPEVLERHALPNLAFWFDNPRLADAGHGSGVLSAAWLALTTPGLGAALAPAAIRKRLVEGGAASRWAHLANCLGRPLHTAQACASFLYGRYLARPRLPGFFVQSPTNRYALHYHAEQTPQADSRIELADTRDAHGLARARVRLCWAEQDFASILRAHRLLDQNLRARGAGQLEFMAEEAALMASMRAQAVDGYHQMGGLRMGASPAEGVTDGYGGVFGVPNLTVAGSALFPGAGQANPTLPLVAMALRSAGQIVARLEGGAHA